MASIDKLSVRGEVDRLKAEFEQLRSNRNMPKECMFLMQSMFVIIDLILSIFLERKTKKNSKNASIPPSQTPKDDTAISNTKTN